MPVDAERHKLCACDGEVVPHRLSKVPPVVDEAVVTKNDADRRPKRRAVRTTVLAQVLVYSDGRRPRRSARGLLLRAQHGRDP